MELMSVYTISPGCVTEAVSRFLAGKATPGPGIKMLGRWHKSDASGGYALFESDNPAAAYEFSIYWSDVLDLHSNVVIEDAEAGPAMAKAYGK